MAGQPDFKPPARVVDKTARTAYLKQHPICEISGMSAQSVHHLIKRSQGGDDVPENFLAVDGSGTTGVHGDLERAPTDPRGRAARMAARQVIERHPEKRTYVVATKSEEWLDKYYPDRFRLTYRNGQVSI